MLLAGCLSAGLLLVLMQAWWVYGNAMLTCCAHGPLKQ
jgi:hypothetical protein